MLKARDLANMSIDEIWELPDGHMKLQFDDGIIETTTRRTIFSRYIWEIHNRFPETPILKRHHIQEKPVGSGTHLGLLGHATWDCRAAYIEKGLTVDMEELSALDYEITNNMYNDFTTRCEEYVGSTSIIDVLEVTHHPVIREAMKNVRPTHENPEFSIEKTYEVIKKTLMDPTQLKGNGVAKAARSGLVSIGQILQCVGPRGYPADIDSHIFRNPILTGFAHGITELEHSMTESRSAAKALFFTKEPMSQSEYFNRNIQLSAATLERLHHVDCGSKDSIPFFVKPGDIYNLQGMHYFDNGVEKIIREWDSHLVGKIINMRSVFTCKHPDRQGICVACFGDIGLGVPRYTNIGTLSSSKMQSQIGQKILSTKHEDSNATVEDMVISDYDRQFIRIGQNPNKIYVAEAMANTPFSICFSQEEAKALIDLVHVNEDSVRLLPIGRISALTNIHFITQKKGKTIPSPVTVCTGARNSSLTHEALEHIKGVNWTFTEEGWYLVDMTGWDHRKPLLELPLKHYSTVDYMMAIGSLIKGTTDKGKKSLNAYEGAVGALVALHELVNSKLKVNISHLQVIVLTMMVQSEEERDYRLPFPRHMGDIAKHNKIMARRSLAASMAFQNQTDVMFNVESFILKNRPSHPLDYMMMG